MTRIVTVSIAGAAGTSGTLEVSSNLRDWAVLSPFALTVLPLGIPDVASATSEHRFYRVRTTTDGLPLDDLAARENSVFVAGEGFDTVQYSSNGSLGFIAWKNRDLIFRERNTGGLWTEATVASNGSNFDPAPKLLYVNFQPKAVFVYDEQSVPHVFIATGGNTILHYARNGASWGQIESLSAPGVVTRLVGSAGKSGSLHLGILTDSTLVYGFGRAGNWSWANVDSVAQDPPWMPGSFSRRWFSLAIDNQNAAHFVYRPSFDFSRHPEGYMRAYTKLKYASNSSGTWDTRIVREPDDISGEVGSGQSIAIGPNGRPAIASWYNERGDGGSSQWSRLQFYEMADNGQWLRSEVISRPENYIAGDGEKGTGAYPYLRFDPSGRPHIVFTDHAAEHFPYQNEYAGNLRHAVREGGEWKFDTVIAQDKPLQQQILFPAFAVGSSEISFLALERLTSWNTSVNPQVAASTYKFRFVTRPL